MARNRKDELVAWLRDAHAMEMATIDNLERLIPRTDTYPQLKAQLQNHLDISHRQVREVKAQLERLGADTSTLKDWAMRFTGRFEVMLVSFTRDELPKNCIVAHAWEAFEVASYSAMLGAAEELNMPELLDMCERFIQEEREMADFLANHLPAITRQYLQRYAPAEAGA
jgi:ferritin-like metal-binding protein YciE